jgi:hypothetical protein
MKSKGPLHAMIQEGMLEQNLFSLSFAATGNNADRGGSLTLGKIDHDAYVGELMSFPMSNISADLEHILPSSWHVDLHEISFGAHTFAMPKHHALLSTMQPFMGLPTRMWKTLLKELNAELYFYYPFVDCSKRSEMPEIFFKLGPDQTVVGMNPWQYIIEFDSPSWGPVCYAPFWPYEESEFPIANSVFLTTGFLRCFYSVFDLDNNTLSRE